MEHEKIVSDEFFRDIVLSSNNHVFCLDTNGNYIYSNSKVQNLGLNNEKQLIGKNLSDFYDKDNLEIYRRNFNYVLTHKKTTEFEHAIFCDGIEKNHSDILFPILRNGKIKCVGGICHDITVEKQMLIDLIELKKIEENNFLTSILAEESNEMTCIFDTKTLNIIYINNKLASILGYKKEELIGRTPDLFLQNHYEMDKIEKLADILKFKKHVFFEDVLFCKNKRKIQVEVSVKYLCLGTKEFFVSSVKDITQKKITEFMIKLSGKVLSFLNEPYSLEKNLKKIVHFLKRSLKLDGGISIKLLNDHLKVLYLTSDKVNKEYLNYNCIFHQLGKFFECFGNKIVNEKLYKKYGYFTKNASFWTNGDNKEKILEFEYFGKCDILPKYLLKNYNTVLSIPLEFEDNINGILQIYDRRKNLLNYDIIKYFENISKSIGSFIERKYYEEKVEIEKNNLSKILDNIQAFAAKLTFDYKILYLNKYFDEFLGIQTDLLVGQNWFDVIIPDIFKEKEKLSFAVNFEKGNYNEVEGVIKSKDGIKNVLWNIIRLNENGKNVFLFIGMNITELKKLQKRAIENEKFLAVGRLTGSIAHELNQPLNAIRNLCQSILFYYKHNMEVTEKEIKNNLAISIEQVDKMADIIKNMRVFTRKNKESDKNIILLNEIVYYPLSMMNSHLRNRNIEMKIKVPEEKIYIKGFLNRLKEMIINFVYNSRDALILKSDFSQKLIQLELIYDKATYEAKIIIRDNGMGIREEDKSKIFEPFYTTNPFGKGFGLGLSVAYEIIKEHNGKCSLNSDFGKGTEFILTFPIYKKEN